MLSARIAPETQGQVDSVAAKLSKIYCPKDSGGIDAATRATVYNYNALLISPKSIW